MRLPAPRQGPRELDKKGAWFTPGSSNSARFLPWSYLVAVTNPNAEAQRRCAEAEGRSLAIE